MAAALTLLLVVRLPAAPELSPCDAYGRTEAVFIGEAGSSIRRAFNLPDGQVTQGTFSPVTVERAFRGVSTSVVFIQPAGIERYLTPGERYLVYGRQYVGRDMFMLTDAYGTKPLGQAANDLEFLEAVTGNISGAAISGYVELDESDSAHIGTEVSPLTSVPVRLIAG